MKRNKVFCFITAVLFTTFLSINIVAACCYCPPGPTGPTGPAGEDGRNGADGINGTNGHDGVDGINGANGQNGATGNTGATGTNGRNGATGNTGANGTNGKTGATGKTGASGVKGEKGDTGVAGEDRPENDSGTAVAMAMAGARYTPSTAGKSTIGIAGSTYAGQQAIGVDFTYRLHPGDSELKPDFFSGGVGYSDREVGGVVSVGWEF